MVDETSGIRGIECGEAKPLFPSFKGLESIVMYNE
jgi:hypothetical protein